MKSCLGVMMTDMTKRVAAALLELEGLPFPKVGSCDYDAAMRRARVAIAAMREPTDEMKDAFRIGADVQIKAGQIVSGKGWTHGWHAAIDAALQEDKP
ncbi:hypothetical protein LCGC14_0653680 [marine sediment metagenome]|uniref:Uncharacterized protein n=1 Tax=marine sediment metagenome TaxID=412755 RepID=A0A0F9U3Y1_9ZZZZ